MDDLQSELSFAKQGNKPALPTLTYAKIFVTSRTYGWIDLGTITPVHIAVLPKRRTAYRAYAPWLGLP